MTQFSQQYCWNLYSCTQNEHVCLEQIGQIVQNTKYFESEIETKS